jgi:hypothetical protein
VELEERLDAVQRADDIDIEGLPELLDRHVAQWVNGGSRRCSRARRGDHGRHARRPRPGTRPRGQ